jgi:hypothetical protein
MGEAIRDLTALDLQNIPLTTVRRCKQVCDTPVDGFSLQAYRRADQWYVMAD